MFLYVFDLCFLLHARDDSDVSSDEEVETWRGGRLEPAELGCLDHPVTYDESIALLQERHGSFV